MRYERCQCGKATAWTTDSFQDCQGCDACGTTFAGHPDFHKPKIAHDWEPRFDPHTGGPDGRQCARCHTREKMQDANVTVTAVRIAKQTE